MVFPMTPAGDPPPGGFLGLCPCPDCMKVRLQREAMAMAAANAQARANDPFLSAIDKAAEEAAKAKASGGLNLPPIKGCLCRECQVARARGTPEVELPSMLGDAPAEAPAKPLDDETKDLMVQFMSEIARADKWKARAKKWKKRYKEMQAGFDRAWEREIR